MMTIAMTIVRRATQLQIPIMTKHDHDNDYDKG